MIPNSFQMNTLLWFILKWYLAAGFTFLVEDTNIAVETEESVTLMALYYNFKDISPEYCKERTTYLSAAIADTLSRTDHDCDRFGEEYNLFLNLNNAFLAEFRHICAKVSNIALYEDPFEVQKYPICTLNITSLNLMKERIHNLANLLTSFTYWKCDGILKETGTVKNLYSMQLAQYFSLLDLSMQEIIWNFQLGYQILHQLSLRTPYQVESLLYDCVADSQPVSDIQVQQCHKNENNYYCLIELKHKQTQLIQAFSPVSYGGYSLDGPLIGFKDDEYGKIQCDNVKCIFYPYPKICSDNILQNNVPLIIWHCPFAKHDKKRDLLETPLGVLVQENCDITLYNDTYAAALSYSPPILINSPLEMTVKCKNQTYNYTSFTNLDLYIGTSNLSNAQIGHLTSHFFLKTNLEGIGLIGLYIIISAVLLALGSWYLIVRFRSYFATRKNLHKIKARKDYILKKYSAKSRQQEETPLQK